MGVNIDIGTWVTLLGFVITLLIMLVGITTNWQKMEAKINTVEALATSKITALESKLYNSNKELDRLTERVSNHKNRVEGKIDLVDSKLDAHRESLRKQIDEVKNLIIKNLNEK